MTFRVSPEEFAKLAGEAVASLPAEFRRRMENVAVEIRSRPSQAMLRSLGVPPGESLMGLYEGVPQTEKTVEAPYEWPERIILFQRSIEQACGSRDEILREIRKTVLHEVGHHFGMDEEELRRMGYE